MRKRSSLSAVACLTLTILVACNDVPVAAPSARPSPNPQASLTTSTDPLGVQIQNNINALFPPTEAASLTYKWNKVLDELAEAQLVISKPLKYQSEIDRAHELLTYAVNYIVAKTYKIIPPAGETKEHAAARLSLMMSVYVYSGPDTPAPSVPAGSDAVVAVVQPSATATTTVQTPTRHAGVQFPPGSLGETRIVVITQNMTPYPANCSGPLDTRLCQYPQFYDFSVFPDTRLLTPAIAAVCHVTSGSARAPLADHNRFAIAHDAPANPADRVDGGTIVDGVEVLPFVLVSGLTSCSDNSYQVGAAPPAPRGALGSAVHWLAEPATRLASAIFDRLAPREAWAIDGLGGGRLSVFSNFGVVDPYGVPDLDVGAVPSAIEVPGETGNAVQIGAWAVRNVGTASARNVSVQVVVAADTLLRGGVVASASLGQAASLAPGDTLSGSGVTLDLPATFAAGTYYVGIVATLDNETGLSDANVANNLRSAPVQIGTPSGSWTALASAPTTRSDAAGGVIAGKLYVVGGAGTDGLESAVEGYDPQLDAWSTLAAMPAAREDPAAAVIEGRLYLAGGAGAPAANDPGSESDVRASGFLYDAYEDIWLPISPMPTPRWEAAGAAINGRFYVVGGAGTDGLATGAVEAYDPGTNQWTTLAAMPTPRFSAGAAVAGGVLYVAGGFVDGTIVPVATLEAFDPLTGAWVTRAPMPEGRAELCLAAIDGVLYAVGGVTDDGALTRVATVEAYDPATDKWTPRASLDSASSPGTCGVIGSRLYVAAGTGASGELLSTLAAFTP